MMACSMCSGADGLIVERDKRRGCRLAPLLHLLHAVFNACAQVYLFAYFFASCARCKKQGGADGAVEQARVYKGFERFLHWEH